ncbi:MAG: hypothetical protein K9J37_19725 [Saprospiraceae bacterium]|nr:hypothetical protein [Saprospiraceae bacterium]MCF8252156.1 hypothetical protein [Saprospiraceae bacterium]MCF8282435.1 hypothetical protein [Bacteroidales bacterium]MCF8313825.1 hypothetical protein [Saprospiraceae bacterium]MCF8442531.1 hypothetical protein [Saprospiraceae bacterium]
MDSPEYSKEQILKAVGLLKYVQITEKKHSLPTTGMFAKNEKIPVAEVNRIAEFLQNKRAVEIQRTLDRKNGKTLKSTFETQKFLDHPDLLNSQPLSIKIESVSTNKNLTYMSESFAKLKAIRERANALMELHSQPPASTFESLRDQFLKEAEKLKLEFPILADFVPENYFKFKVPGSEIHYYKWAPRALISDIDYFITYIDNIKSVQLPNLKITSEGLFFAGQYFEALSKLVDIIKTAKSEIIFIDGYVNEKVLEIFAITEGKVSIKILTKAKSASPAFTALVTAFNMQYANQLEVKTSEAFHDRFLILDGTEFYHIGASMKDAGNKGFMFSRIEEPFLQENLLSEFHKVWI